MEEKGLQVFDFKSQDLRIEMTKSEPWWVADSLHPGKFLNIEERYDKIRIFPLLEPNVTMRTPLYVVVGTSFLCPITKKQCTHTNEPFLGSMYIGRHIVFHEFEFRKCDMDNQ